MLGLGLGGDRIGLAFSVTGLPIVKKREGRISLPFAIFFITRSVAQSIHKGCLFMAILFRVGEQQLFSFSGVEWCDRVCFRARNLHEYSSLG